MIKLDTGGVFGPHSRCTNPELAALGMEIAHRIVDAELTISQMEIVLAEAERIIFHVAPLGAPKKKQPRPEETPDEAAD